MVDVIVIGGGLAGLFAAWQLKESGFDVTVIEKKKYPFQRVCGEYVSNEVIPFLESRGLFPHELQPATIDQFRLTSVGGAVLDMPLDLGGFGISRFAWDHWLVQKLQSKGVIVKEGESVQSIRQSGDSQVIKTSNGHETQARLVIGAFGKRSILDKSLDRSFMRRRSPYVGVKYHVKYDFPDDTVALHNFPGGYCGINKVEGEKYNLCYLTQRDNLRTHGNIPAMEEAVLHRNPYLREIFNEATFLLEQPEVINEVTFEAKEPVYQGIFMVGDAAGMITPLCGNGMAMAIHSSKLLFDCIAKYGLDGHEVRTKLENEYSQLWRKKFAFRLSSGRTIQRMFGGKRASSFAVGLGRTAKPIAQLLMAQTHGSPFS
ncbi:MAG: NAD(P)/FAD-dependent oxidoreductase [Bacteroidota bacterium]